MLIGEKMLGYYPNATKVSIIILLLLTILATIIQRWLDIHYLRKSKSAFVSIWLQYVVIAGMMKIYQKRLRFNLHTGFSSRIITMVLYASVVILMSCDITSFTRKSSGTEFYQTNLILVVPVIWAIHDSNNSSKVLFYSNGICTVWKMLFLFKDQEFNVSFGLSCKCFIYTTAYCYFLIYIKFDLEKTGLADMIYNLSEAMIFILPFIILINGEIQQMESSLIFPSFLLAATKLFSIICSFLLIKNTDVLTYLLTVNVAFIPEYLIQALVYKLDCTASASKVSVFVVLDFILLLIFGKLTFKEEQERLAHTMKESEKKHLALS